VTGPSLPSPGVLGTRRLLLRPITAADAAAVVAGRRAPDWADDFPAEGDREIAGMLHRQPPAGSGDAAPWGHRLVVERASGLVVGGVGFFGPPIDGRVEVGYGIVPSRRGLGYAPEAVRGLLAFAFDHPDVGEVVAGAEPANRASHRVLEKAGLTLRGRSDGLVRFAVRRPG
jgi:[ribosomal protein S5]-alanine N-acetyltransferase